MADSRNRDSRNRPGLEAARSEFAIAINTLDFHSSTLEGSAAVAEEAPVRFELVAGLQTAA